jgi:O-antigen ligase
MSANPAISAFAIARERPAVRWTFDYRKLVDGFFWLTMFSGSVVFIEPSPYDILILITITLWAFGGFSVHRAILPFVLFLSLWTFGGFVSLIPYWHEEDPVAFMFHTLFITTTGLFFALFLSQRTARRAELLLSAYTASCVLAAAIAVSTWLIGYGEEGAWVLDGRAMAPFKDPNVLGSYLVTGLLYLVQRLLLGKWRWLWLTLPSLALIVVALFLSFSRGSWGAALVSLTMVVAFLFRTADSRAMRLRIASGAAGVFFAGAVALTGALSVDSVRDFFFRRAAVTQDYDEGPNGRFGNQARSIPMLLGLPNGFGPLRFRLIFDIEPHNSYINAFASNGWLGGFAFLALAVSTFFIGFRQCLTRHPWLRASQILCPATFVFFLQGLQIDIDHWRMFYVSLGAVWGIEAARRRWIAQGRPGVEGGSEIA